MGPNADTGVKADDKLGKYISVAWHRHLIVSMNALYNIPRERLILQELKPISPLSQFAFMAWCSVKERKHRATLPLPLPLFT
jgi:hypothetical protein